LHEAVGDAIQILNIIAICIACRKLFNHLLKYNFMNKLILLLMCSLIVSCAHYSPIYWDYDEWEECDFSGIGKDSIARLEWSKVPGVIRSIDGNTLRKYKKAKLSPGMHTFEYADYPAEFGVPLPINGTIEIELKEGHLYEFNIKYCYWCIPRQFAVWIDDKTTGEVAWGKRPDWPSWYL